tara:strand:+ start:3882 stop:4118 length:237 start_codon:yes stop_codon:yes gene_type:complete
MKIVRYLKIQGQIIDLEGSKGYCSAIRKGNKMYIDFSDQYVFDIKDYKEGDKIYDFIYNHVQEYDKETNYKTIEYKND